MPCIDVAQAVGGDGLASESNVWNANRRWLTNLRRRRRGCGGGCGMSGTGGAAAAASVGVGGKHE